MMDDTGDCGLDGTIAEEEASFSRSSRTARTPPNAFTAMMNGRAGQRPEVTVGAIQGGAVIQKPDEQVAVGNGFSVPPTSDASVVVASQATINSSNEWSEFIAQLDVLESEANKNSGLMNTHRTTAKAIQLMAGTLTRAVSKLKLLLPSTATMKACQCSVRSEDETVAIIHGKIDAGIEADQLKDLLKQSWPDKAFRITREESIDGLIEGFEANLIVHPSPAAAVQHPSIKRMGSIIHELPIVMAAEGLKPGSVAEISGSSNIKIDGRQELRSHCTVVGRPLVLGELPLTDIIRRMATGLTGIKTLAVVTGCGVKRTRKALEVVFAGRDIAIAVCDVTEVKSGRRIGVQHSTAVTVTGDGRSYADLVKLVKSAVDIEANGIEVLKVAKRNDSALTIRVRGGADKAGVFAKAVKGIEGAEARVNMKHKVVHIHDLECDVTAAEITDGIRRVCPSAEPEDIIVTSVRPDFSGSAKATVKVAPRLVNEVVNRKRIRIGWVTCRVVLRQDIKHCHKCWQPDHLAGSCKGPDRRKACFRCGEDGHVRSSCVKDTFCPVCKSNTHSFGGRECLKGGIKKSSQ